MRIHDVHLHSAAYFACRAVLREFTKSLLSLLSSSYSRPSELSPHRLFHLTLPTHLTQPCTSSLSIRLSTVKYSLANSSLLATRCTKL